MVAAVRLAAAAALCLALWLPVPARAEPAALTDDQLAPWEQYWQQGVGQVSLRDLLDSVMAGENPDVLSLLESALAGRGTLLLRGFASAVLRLMVLAALEVMLGLFAGQGEGGSLFGARCVILASAVLFLSSQCLSVLEGMLAALGQLSGFVNGAVPVLMPLMVASGWSASSGLLQPATLALTAWMDQWLRPVMTQGVSMLMLLEMADAFSRRAPLAGVIAAGRRLVQWFLGLCLTGFVAVVGIQASAMMSYDSLALRSARYAVDSTVPGVGGFFADMLDTAVISAQMIRSGLGIASLVVIAVLILQPVLELALFMLSLDLAAALGGVLGDSALAGLYRRLSALVRLLLYGLLISALLALMLLSLGCMAGMRG